MLAAARREFTERLAEIVSVMDDTAPLTIGAVAVTTWLPGRRADARLHRA